MSSVVVKQFLVDLAYSEDILWKEAPNFALREVFEHAFSKFSNLLLFGSPTQKGMQFQSDTSFIGIYSWKSYKEVQILAHNLIKGIMAFGLCPQIKEFQHSDREHRILGICTGQCEEETLLFIACQYANVALSSFFTNGVIHWLQYMELTTVVCYNETIKELIEAKKTQDLKYFQNIVCLGLATELEKNSCAEVGLNLYEFSEILKKGESIEIMPESDILEASESLAMVVLTSGSTGNPKGIKLSQKNILAQAVQLQKAGFTISTSERTLFQIGIQSPECFHVLLFAYQGGMIAFPSKACSLLEACSSLKPVMFFAVPRALTALASILKKIIEELLPSERDEINRILKIKKELLLEKNIITGFEEALERIKSINLRWIYVGAAEIDQEILIFLKTILCVPILQVYGQSEITGPATLQSFDDHSCASVGYPLCFTHIKLVDIPELGLSCSDSTDGKRTPRGEICFKGVTLYKGYYKDEKLTNESLNDDGWHYSGDLGMISENGDLKFIGRNNVSFKTQAGIFINPEALEALLLSIPIIEQIFVYGDTFQEYLIAIVVPNEDKVMEWAEIVGLKGSYEDIVIRNSDLKFHICNAIKECSYARTTNSTNYFYNELVKSETPQKIHLELKCFSQENGLLSTLLKIRREEAKKVYENVIASLYRE